MPETTATEALSRRLPSTKLLLAVLVPALFLGLFAWSLASPIGSSPDDDFHQTNIWCAVDQPGPECDPTSERPAVLAAETGLARMVPARVGSYPCYKQNDQSAACLDQVGTELVPGRANAGTYPSGFYRVMHVFASDNAEASVLAIRIFNALIAVVLVGAALLLTDGGLRRAVALTWLLGLAPLAAFFLPSVNPSSWVIAGVGTFWAFLLRFLLNPSGWRGIASGCLAAVTAVMATIARPDGPAFLAVASLACLVLAPTTRRDLVKRQYLLCYAVGVLALVFALTRESITNVLRHGVGAPDAAGGGSGLLLHNLGHVLQLGWLGLYGNSWGLGWGEAKMPLLLGILGTYLLVGALVVTWPSQRGRKIAVVAALFVLVVGTPLYVLQRNNSQVGGEVQPRYLLPLVLLFLAFLSLTLGRRYQWRLPWWGVLPAALILTITNAVALHVLMDGYAFGHGLDSGFTGGAWWWSHGAMLPVWILGVLAMAVAYAALAVTALSADQTSEVDRSTQPVETTVA